MTTYDDMIDLIARMRTVDIQPPRTLHCGRVAWQILQNITDKTTDVLGLTRDHFDSLGLYGTPVIIDPDMPDGAWKILEGDREVISGDFAPGHRRAALVPGVGLIGFSDEIADLVEGQ